MANVENIEQQYSSDILIIGGGIAGLVAAIKMKEYDSTLDVLIVDKATTGLSGSKANKGAGVLQVIPENKDVDEFIEYNLKNIGHYLNDQDLMRKYAYTSREVVKDLERWGIPCMREEDGSLSGLEALPHWCLTAIDLDFMFKLHKIANQLGIKMVNKTQTVEVLTNDNRAVGCVGFNIISGEYAVFKAKATVLATGSCNWDVAHMWRSGRGDGIAAAYRAGAELRNAEYANFHNVFLPAGMSVQVGSQYSLYNKKGERLSDKYCKENECDFDIGIFLGMEKEVMEGNGPIVWEESEFFNNNPLAAGGLLFKWNRPWADNFHWREMGKEEKYSSDNRWKPIAEPLFIGELSAVKTDHNMKTTIEGLWAIGDTSRGGAGMSGAVAGPPARMRGSGLMWAAVSSLLCYEDVAKTAKVSAEAEIDAVQVAKFKEEIYAPMKCEKGLDVRDNIHNLKETVAPPRFSLRKNADRIDEALDMIHEIQNRLPTISPQNDYHLLGQWHDLKNMALCGELVFTAAMDRTESRGWHVREDYPERDDKNWLKWIVLKNDNGKIAISYDDIPMDQYKFKPE